MMMIDLLWPWRSHLWWGCTLRHSVRPLAALVTSCSQLLFSAGILQGCKQCGQLTCALCPGSRRRRSAL